MKKLNRNNNNKNAEIQSDKISSVKGKIFQKFTVKEIVFLAILSAVLILSCSVMAIVAEATKVVWAVGQVSTALQLSMFLTIGLMRVRKVFTTTFVLLFMGIVMVMMSPVMAISNLFVLVCVELLIMLIFKGYESDKACMFGGFMAPMLSIVTPAVYNSILVPEVFSAVTSNVLMMILMTALCALLAFIGSFIGMKIGSELQKSGVMKNG